MQIRPYRDQSGAANWSLCLRQLRAAGASPEAVAEFSFTYGRYSTLPGEEAVEAAAAAIGAEVKWLDRMPLPVTRIQLMYLKEARNRGHFAYGWGGYKSTRTVRLLQERGYITISDRHCAAGAGLWCVTSLTAKGAEVLERLADS